MFPGRWPNFSENMWNYGWSAPSFPSPQPAVPFGQFCGGDMMSQQSQAQSQAQTQAQLAQLREQNSILNQQLASQAQTHIQHLQQLLPFHQSNSPAMQPRSTPPTPDPPTPTPVAPPSTQTGSNVAFNPEEMMQQMRHTVESGMQAFVDKNKERRVLLHRLNHHQLQFLHRFQVILQFQSLIYHHFHVPIAALVHVLIGIVQFRTNVQSLFHEVHVVTSLPVAYVALLDHTDVDTPLREIDQDFQVVLLQSLCAQPPHNVVKHYMIEMMITLVMFHTTSQLLSNLPFGNNHITIKLRCSTRRTTSPTTNHMTNLQSPSGNHGVNGKTIPRPPTTHTRQAGSTTPRPFPNIHSTPILHPNLHPNPSLHFLLNTPPTVVAIIHVGQAQSNPVAPPPLFLQDMFPSTFKTARKMNGLVMSVMLCTTQTECVQQMNLVPTSVHSHPCPSNRHITMQPWNSSIRWTRESLAI